jgi:SprT protein
MAKKEAPISHLQQFLPPGTYEPVFKYLQQYHVHLTIARERKSILGDYRHRTYDRNHRISVNGNLNQYAFLITLLHELAHLLQFEQYGNKVYAHGAEWKNIFSKLLAQFIEHNIFPADVKNALVRSLTNPAATSCADDTLLRVLKTYDLNNKHLTMVEQVPANSLFKTADGKIFKKGSKLRKRYQCVEVSTKKLYLFSPVYEVEIVSETRL